MDEGSGHPVSAEPDSAEVWEDAGSWFNDTWWNSLGDAWGSEDILAPIAEAILDPTANVEADLAKEYEDHLNHSPGFAT